MKHPVPPDLPPFDPLPDDFEPLDPEEYPSLIGAIIRYAREHLRDISLHRAEDLSEVDRHHWRQVEEGEKSLTDRTKIKICNALRIRPSDLDRMVEAWLKARRRIQSALPFSFWPDLALCALG